MINLSAIKPTTLKSALSSTALTMKVRAFVDRHGNYPDWADLDTEYIVAVAKQGDQWEQIKITNLVQEADGTCTMTIDATGRGILPIPPYTGYATGFEFGIVADVIFTNDMLTMSTFANKQNANTFEELNIFNTYAPQTPVAPVNPNDLVNLTALQSAILGTLTTINVILPAKAGATIVAGNSVYFDLTSNNWKLTDADDPTTVQNVLLGIAQGSGTSGNPITGGVLLQGIDSHQTGMTEGDVQYASNTAGGISSSAGTNEVTLGLAKSATELYFAPRFNQQMTEEQQDALDNALGGALSSSNPVISSNDVSNSGVSNKIVRAVGTKLPALDGSNLTNINALAIVASCTYGETISANVPVYIKPSDGKAYKASASSYADPLLRYFGISQESGVLDDVKKVALAGSASGISSLGTAYQTVSEVTEVSKTSGGSSYNATQMNSGYLFQTFMTGDQENISSLQLSLKKAGAPNNNLTITLYEIGTDGLATGSALATKNFTESDLTTTYALKEILSSPITVKPRWKYGFAIDHNSSNISDPATEWLVQFNSTANTYTKGEYSYNNGGTKVYVTNGACLDFVMKYTAERKYYIGDDLYLGDTAGTFSLVPATKTKKVGEIVSATEILINDKFKETYIGTIGLNKTQVLAGTCHLPFPHNTRKIIIYANDDQYNEIDLSKGQSSIVVDETNDYTCTIDVTNRKVSFSSASGFANSGIVVTYVR